MKQIASLRRLFTRFQSDDCGAVTVDWVVLAAACVSMALGSISIWRDSAQHNAEDIASVASNFQIKTRFD